MIKLCSRHCLVTGDDGTVRSLDTDALRQGLRGSFRSCGLAQDWAADHIALVIEEHLSSRCAPEHQPMSEREVHGMAYALLSASGYNDVGDEYCRTVPDAVRPEEADPPQPWDRARLDAELARVLPLDDSECSAIAAQVAAVLTGLRLHRVSSELVRELGRHLMRQILSEATPLPADSPWILPAGLWPVRDVPGAEGQVLAGVIRPLPVSRFLPKVRIELDLRALAAASGRLPLPELVYLPALARCLDGTAELLARTCRSVGSQLPHGSTSGGHLVVYGLQEVIRDAILPQAARAAKALRQEIVAIIEAKLAPDDDRAVMVTFR